MWRRFYANGRRFGARYFSDCLRVSDEVQSALSQGRGVVALESTVITHGMPYPENVKTTKELESIIRKEQCVPATIALADGLIHVGISDNLLERLASARDVTKVSRRDLAMVLGKRSLGGTTVSATMIAAKMAGISVFSTGGIGGVHRGVEESWDISADLTELGRTPVAVVSAGIKSILDVPKTLEFLETQGVPVIAYGPDKNWPGFFTPTSGCEAPYQSDDVDEIAEFINISKRLNLEHGFVIGVPIPKTEYDIGAKLQKAIDQAVEEARKSAVSGREVTPFVLKRINELTGGLSLKANIVLLKNNAMVGARIAKALSDLRRDDKRTSTVSPTDRQSVISAISNTKKKDQDPEAVVVGGTIVDFYVGTNDNVRLCFCVLHNVRRMHSTGLDPLQNAYSNLYDHFRADGGTYPGLISQASGGVGRNHADTLTRLGLKTLFISAFGTDPHADFVKTNAPHMDFRAVRKLENVPTATYAGITSGGNLSFGVGSMQAHDYVTVDWVRQYETRIAESKMIILDGNIPRETIEYVCDVADSNSVPVWFDPTDQSKSIKICRGNVYNKLSYISPNFNEFLALIRGLDLPLEHSLMPKFGLVELRNYLLDKAHLILKPDDRSIALVITMGVDGLLLLHKKQDSYEILHYDPPVAAHEIVNVSGAGDCLNAGIIRGLLSTPSLSITRAVDLGLTCARASLRSKIPVPPELETISLSQNDIPYATPTWKRSIRR